jgi:hypothetical protein
MDASRLAPEPCGMLEDRLKSTAIYISMINKFMAMRQTCSGSPLVEKE